ncbi:ATP-binding protein [Natrarchaeobius oligotrophus]|uniref:histidine kinase n=1 Tax=Natrarchaeobius chitinivorans TaxID=1679083 RepID=A0A3N6M5Z5_NATCH|nr:ATP-binding protein [Natrarchaeobius chitinivorans]RQG99003.1 GHKL domain-containing protein [Natrarchaeobius chitinivorans]
MATWERFTTALGAGRIIIVLGTLFIASAVIRGASQVDAGAPVVSALFVSLFITVPGVLLIYGGYRLPETDVRTEFYPIVAKWCVGGFFVMIAFLGIYHVVVEGGISNPVRAVLILSAFSSLAGLGLGVREARTRTREREVEEVVERLRESNERLEQFAYAASHDLQEPLRMVSSYLQLLEHRYGDRFDEDGREFLAYAVDGADRMREMVDALLVYSRVDTDGASLSTVDLEEVLDDVIADLAVTIDENDAEITVENAPRVTGDETQLKQLLQNLVSNAIEYSDDEPVIHVSAKRNGTNWILSVRDEGIGIEPADHERIFEVFNRLHTREDHPGTGIGLALCQRIVERHGGDIWVESAPGDGATFSFTLPTTDERAP